MSVTKVGTKAGKRTPGVYAVAGILAALVLMGIAYRVFLTIPVTIDGVDVRLIAGTRVSDLVTGKRVHGHPGNLVSAKDRRILKLGAGESPFVAVNGSRASADMRLNAADVVKSMNGSDTVEPIAKRTEPIPAPVHYEGHGVLESVLVTGVPGVAEVSFGSLSKQIVGRRTLQEPVAQLVRRQEPTSGAKVVALTFDDGPWPGSTEAILSILQKYGIKATFFEIGAQAKGRPQLSKKIADAGMMLGNHTEDHLNLKHLDAAHVAREIQQAETNIEKASGQRPKYFRPPGGNVSPDMWPVLSSLGMKMAMWDIDTNDWRKPAPSVIAQRVLGGVRPGSVVLMHDGGGDRKNTVAALPTIIEGLKKMGYQFVTLDGIANLPQKMG
jgi:peptidoglycan-N-acetylglucosamine deacetylase